MVSVKYSKFSLMIIFLSISFLLKGNSDLDNGCPSCPLLPLCDSIAAEYMSTEHNLRFAETAMAFLGFTFLVLAIMSRSNSGDIHMANIGTLILPILSFKAYEVGKLRGKLEELSKAACQ